MEFKKENLSFILEKDKGESLDNLNIRGNFILLFDLNKNDLNYLVNLSKIYINYKFKNCIYNNNIMKIIYDKDKLMDI
jgi:hypothetical protein